LPQWNTQPADALQPHTPETFITRIAPVTFDPTATCPAWEHFLQEVFAGERAMVEFLQRAIGWSLTGVVQEHALFSSGAPRAITAKPR
jgi:putative DNA primase/helicase